MKTEEAQKNGLFGHGLLHKKFKSRIGDILILPCDNRTIWYRHPNEDTFNLFAMHGGLSSDEMLIPFATARLENIL